MREREREREREQPADLLKYNPTHGHAHFFTPEGHQLRAVHLLPEDVDQKHKEEIGCDKLSYSCDAKQGRINNTDSLFITSCADHSVAAAGGYHLVKGGAESKMDGYIYMEANKPFPCALRIYDNACA